MSERIGPLIHGVLAHAAKQHGPLFALQRDWKRFVGRALARHTRPASLRRGKLVVHADRPGDGFMLGYQQTQILERIRAFGPPQVDEIIIRPARE